MARDAPGGREFLLIHRHRYGDWTLPKGKLHEGESAVEAAIREVREETGCPVEVGTFLGEVRYAVNGVPKVVEFWNMKPAGAAGAIEDRGEVREAVWLSATDAMARLDYALEREILGLAIQRGGA